MKNALIVIDIQNDYFPGGSFPLEAPETACKGAVNAIEKAREEGWLIVGIQHIATADAPFFRPDSEGAKIHPDVVLETGLEQLLRDNGITDIYLTGMMTQHCVTHTALSPQGLGMNMHIIAEGCAAPTKALSDLALFGLSARCSVK